MAISFFETAWNTAGTVVSANIVHKDLVITGVVSGDLIVVATFAEGTQASTTSHTIATQAGSTGAWTIVKPATTVDDVGVVLGYALATGSGSVTVRGTINAFTFSNRMGVGAYLVPTADRGSTHGWVGTGFANDADGQASVTLSATSITMYFGGDWTAGNMGSTTTPAGGIVDRTYFDTTNYAVFISRWTAQASGTRNYGPSGLSARDISGGIMRIDSPGGGGSVAITATTAVVATSAASVNTRTPLGATTPIMATSSAVLSARTPIAATTPVASTVAATIATRTPIAATIPVSSIIAATIATRNVLSATTSIVSTTSASLNTRQSITAITPVVSTVSADISLPGAISVTVAVTSAVSASISVRQPLSATTAVVSTVTATIGTRRAITATSLIASATVVILGTRVTLTATVVVVSTVAANITSDIVPVNPSFPFPLTLAPSAKYNMGLSAESPTLELHASGLNMTLEGAV